MRYLKKKAEKYLKRDLNVTKRDLAEFISSVSMENVVQEVGITLSFQKQPLLAKMLLTENGNSVLLILCLYITVMITFQMRQKMTQLDNEAHSINSDMSSLSVSLKEFWKHIHSNDNIKAYYAWKNHTGNTPCLDRFTLDSFPRQASGLAIRTINCNFIFGHRTENQFHGEAKND